MLTFQNNKGRKAFWEKLHKEVAAEKIQAALDALPPVQARVLQLHYQQLYSFKEIARVVGRSVSAIRNDHSTAIFSLAKQFYSSADYFR